MRALGKTNRILSTAIGAMLGTAMLSASAFGQARVNNGNALDANNRIGSGGFNQGAGDRYRGPYAGYTANDVINANVTAGKTFRGPVPYRDPGAFTGPNAGNEVD